MAEGDVLVLMNDDAQPQPGWLLPLLNAIESDELGLCSPSWHHARLGAFCLTFPRSTYELLGGMDDRYIHWCADQDYELRAIDAGLRIRQVPESNVAHNPGDPLRIGHRVTERLGDCDELPNTALWYEIDQAMFESIWGDRKHHDHWPADWSQVA